VSRTGVKKVAPTTVFSAAATNPGTSSKKMGALGALDPWSTDTASGEMTVEQFLEQQCETILDDVRKHSQGLISKLKEEYSNGAAAVQEMMKEASSSSSVKNICIILKCNTGPHIGQKFRLEAPADLEGDSFKVGRSTAKAFKEKGLSLYKDKEVSTSHGKFEIRNGQPFFIDTQSTNGTQLNGATISTQEPALLKDGDVLNIGSTEVSVNIAITEDDIDSENFASV
jgi:hypothetical protein